MKYYKFLTENNKGQYSGFDFSNYLPKNGEPGEWLPKVESLNICHSGYHACKREDVFEWLNAQMFEVELRGKKITGDNKIASQEMRFVRKLPFDDRDYRLFACWCAEQVLPIFEKEYPNDDRPRKAIKIARLFADGKATTKELAATRDAARDADWGAAWAVVWDDVRATSWDAIRDAARAVAWAATRATSWGAAWDAARAVAWAVAWAAARDADWGAARKSQLQKFCEMVGI